MRVVRKPKPTRAAVSRTETYPAPVRGLNYLAPLAAMKPTDALRLDNLFCQPSAVVIRKGSVTQATGLPAAVETLATYTGVSSAQKRFAFCGTEMYDVTSSGAVGAAVLTGLSNAYWSFTQVSNTAGNYLFACNGADSARIYDGSSWAASGFTGVSSSSLDFVAVWKRRVWWVEKNSTTAWYGGTDAISGAMSSKSFSGIFRRGGKLIAILNWTIDGGEGTDDFFVAVSSEGEVAVYKGTDPTSDTTFYLVGLYFIGTPVGRRFYASFGGDLYLLTSQGLLSLSRYLQSQAVDRASALSYRIQSLLSQDISSYGTTQGWEVVIHFDANMVLVQVPAGVVGARYQYAMNTITGAWSRFLYSAAVTWAVQGTALYYGAATTTVQGWTGGTDDGNDIRWVEIPAFSYFGKPTRQKKFNLGRTLVRSERPPTFAAQLLVDFNETYYLPAPNAAPASGNLWDVAIWDQAVWDTLTSYSLSWYALAGVGYAITQAYIGASNTDTMEIISHDYVWEDGGLL